MNMRTNITLLFFMAAAISFSQTFQLCDTIHPPSPYENVYVRKLYSDTLSSSFMIFIKNEVKLHKHISHTEHVYVLQGKGKMKLGENEFEIQKGNMIFIPKNTAHSVKCTGNDTLQVISIQSPYFDGTDRVMME